MDLMRDPHGASKRWAWARAGTDEDQVRAANDGNDICSGKFRPARDISDGERHGLNEAGDGQEPVMRWEEVRLAVPNW